MSGRQSQLAKLTRPRLHGAVPRERLFRLLDGKRRQSVVWVNGPPGAGKTTLVASYLEASGSRAVWYHLDRGDSDPATLFYYLAEGIGQASSRHARRLPLLTPEYLPDLEGFARRFLRDAFARLPAGTLLVFDNYHEIAEGSPVHRALNAALAEVPDTQNVIVIGRTPPAAVFARLQLAQALVTVGWDDLRLSAEETAAIAIAHTPDLAPEDVEAIHARADGWVAGVRLLLDRMETGGSTASLNRPHSLDATFDYFAAEIFDAAPDDVQRVLLRTGFLPRFTVGMAVALSDNERAGHILEDLYRRHLFIERRVGVATTYQYHDLFRAFLRSRVERRSSKEEVASLARESAAVLLSGDLADEAFGLFVQGEDWVRAEQVFVDQAQTLIAQGRWQTLQEWGKTLPPVRIQDNPWLRYWLGRSKTLVDPGSARLMLEDAYASFVERNDPTGELLSATAVLDALHFEVKAFQLIGSWLERLARLVDAHSGELPIEDDLRIHATLVMASSHLALPGPTLTRSVIKVKQLLTQCADVNLTLSVANMVHYYTGHSLDLEANRLVTREARPLLDRADLSADRLALYWLAEGHAHYMFARYREALDCIDRADAIIDEHGLVQRALVAGSWRCQCEAAGGDVRTAQATVARTEKRIPPSGHGYLSALFQWAKGVVAFAAGEVERSIDLGLTAIEQNRECGSPISLALWRPRMSYRLIASGRTEQGLEFIAAQRSQADVVAYSHLGAAMALMQAWAALRSGDPAQCDSALREAMALAVDARDRMRLRWFPLALAELLPIALERGIGPEIAGTLITECELRPSGPFLEAWPWSVRIYTLGRFEVRLDQTPLDFGRKAPKRTLALLKAIIALGGKEVPEQWLADALWPEQEGDAAHESLAAALHRLRRLLGVKQVIVQSSGMLSVNPECCFVDAWAFETGVQQPGREQAALRLYRGSFLKGDPDAQWSVSMRERLRGKFVRAVQASARRLEAEGRHEEAIELYSRGLEADDLVEPFYQGLMRSYQNLGRTAEATDTFRRLSRALSGAFGVDASAESQRLFHAGSDT